MSRIVAIDTETTGLDPDTEEVFEVATIDLTDGTERVWRLPTSADVVAAMHPRALEVNRYHDRVGDPTWRWDDLPTALWELHAVLGGAHLLGAVPDFDARHLTATYRREGLPVPRWHHHLIDVETLAVGWLAAQGAGIPLPWKSDDLARWCDVEPPAGEERHTALADARWVKRWYEHLMAGGAA